MQALQAMILRRSMRSHFCKDFRFLLSFNHPPLLPLHFQSFGQFLVLFLGNASNSVLHSSSSTPTFNSIVPRRHLLDFRGASSTHFLLLLPPALQIHNTELNTRIFIPPRSPSLIIGRPFQVSIIVYWRPPLVRLLAVAYFPRLVLLPTIHPITTVLFIVLTL